MVHLELVKGEQLQVPLGVSYFLIKFPKIDSNIDSFKTHDMTNLMPFHSKAKTMGFFYGLLFA
jgi:hypothetical protein